MADNQPTQVSFAPMAATALVSSSVGDQVGNALADVLCWMIQVGFNASPPTGVIGAFHTLCVFACVGASLGVHYFLIKSKT